MTQEFEGVGDKRVCLECVGEDHLRKTIQAAGSESECAYCDRTDFTITIDELADHVEAAFDSHFRRTSNEPSSLQMAMLSDRESEYDWEREGDPVADVIAWTAEVAEEIAADLQEVLDDRTSDFDAAAIGEETAFDGEAHYIAAKTNDLEFQAAWEALEHGLKTEARYFSRTAAATLQSIFEGVNDHFAQDGRPAVVSAGPGTEIPALYRARVFQSGEGLTRALAHPEKELGAPPSQAAVAGRMNARGVSVFYGANDRDVALAEVRPPVGSRVAIAKFEIIRSIRLLDLRALSKVHVTGSVFDPSLIKRLEHAKFLARLSRRITMAVMPDDEPFDYIATQAIADYLASEVTPELDGIIYPSAQANDEAAFNVALFHKSSLASPSSRPDGTKVDVNVGFFSEDEEEDFDIDYRVWEKTPAPFAEDPFNLGPPPDIFRSPQTEVREPILRLERSSLTVNHVLAATFTAVPFAVSFHTSQELELGEEEPF